MRDLLAVLDPQPGAPGLDDPAARLAEFGTTAGQACEELRVKLRTAEEFAATLRARLRPRRTRSQAGRQERSTAGRTYPLHVRRGVIDAPPGQAEAGQRQCSGWGDRIARPLVGAIAVLVAGPDVPAHLTDGVPSLSRSDNGGPVVRWFRA